MDNLNKLKKYLLNDTSWQSAAIISLGAFVILALLNSFLFKIVLFFINAGLVIFGVIWLVIALMRKFTAVNRVVGKVIQDTRDLVDRS